MRQCSDRDPTDMDDVADNLGKLFDTQVALAGQLLRLAGSAAEAVLDGLGGMKMPKGSCSCEIPEPCWMPKDLGEAHCTLAPGETGEVRITITNDDFRAHPVTLQAAGDGAANVSFSQANLNLGPKQRAQVTARYTVPQQVKEGEQDDLVVWVRGCADHYFRWRIKVARCGKVCCHEVEVRDGANYIVHWYDHFYCPRPCPGGGGRQPGFTTGVAVGVAVEG